MISWTRKKKKKDYQQSIFKRMINLSEFDTENILTLTGSFNEHYNLADGFINKAQLQDYFIIFNTVITTVRVTENKEAISLAYITYCQ
jgi:hypothetical protein